jgi:GNAT superfamily N-acetyltransferase
VRRPSPCPCALPSCPRLVCVPMLNRTSSLPIAQVEATPMQLLARAAAEGLKSSPVDPTTKAAQLPPTGGALPKVSVGGFGGASCHFLCLTQLLCLTRCRMPQVQLVEAEPVTDPFPDGSRNYHFTFADGDGQLLSPADGPHAITVCVPDTEATGEYAVIVFFSILTARRKQHFGLAVMEALVQWLRDRKCPSVKVVATGDQPSFFKRCGFQWDPTRTFMYRRLDGQSGPLVAPKRRHRPAKLQEVRCAGSAEYSSG